MRLVRHEVGSIDTLAAAAAARARSAAMQLVATPSLWPAVCADLGAHYRWPAVMVLATKGIRAEWGLGDQAVEAGADAEWRSAGRYPRIGPIPWLEWSAGRLAASRTVGLAGAMVPKAPIRFQPEVVDILLSGRLVDGKRISVPPDRALDVVCEVLAGRLPSLRDPALGGLVTAGAGVGVRAAHGQSFDETDVRATAGEAMDSSTSVAAVFDVAQQISTLVEKIVQLMPPGRWRGGWLDLRAPIPAQRPPAE